MFEGAHIVHCQLDVMTKQMIIVFLGGNFCENMAESHQSFICMHKDEALTF